MASSATLTTTQLPRLRTLLQEWEKKRPVLKGSMTIKNGSEDLNIDSSDDLHIRNKQSKDVIVTFRTRPPLENEATNKFKGNPDQDAESVQGGGETVKELQVEFCAGISVSEPGVFVAHVPGMKVSLCNFFD
jgi:kinesin family member 2/24